MVTRQRRESGLGGKGREEFNFSHWTEDTGGTQLASETVQHNLEFRRQELLKQQTITEQCWRLSWGKKWYLHWQMVPIYSGVQFLLLSLSKSEKTLNSFKVKVLSGKWDKNTAVNKADKTYSFPYSTGMNKLTSRGNKYYEKINWEKDVILDWEVRTGRDSWVHPWLKWRSSV